MDQTQYFLLNDCCIDTTFVLDLTEATSPAGLVAFRGKFQEAEAVNKNKRLYPFAILDENIQRLQSMVKDRRLIGELDHPTDSIVHLSSASHVVTKLWWEGNALMGQGEILLTAHGKQLKALLDSGIKFGISSRGIGNGKVNENGVLVIGEGYKLITFDVVADPSTEAAFQQKVLGKEENVVLPQRLATQTWEKQQGVSVKNEHSRIDTVSKELLIACCGGYIRSNVEQKARLIDHE